MSDVGATFRARGVAVLGRVARRGQTRSPAARWAMLGAALVLVVGSAWYAIDSLSGVPLGDRWGVWLALAALLALAAFVINAAEFAVSARLVGVRAGPFDSFRVSILGSAANILPVPGAALVRSAALKRMGLGYRAAISMTAVMGIAWVAVAGLVTGALLLVEEATAVGALTLLAGVAGGAVSFGLLVAHHSWAVGLRRFPLVLAVELVSVGAGVVRSWVVLHALGVDASFADASMLTAAGIVASAAGLLPGGLGLREALSGAVAAAVGLPAAIGVLVAAVDRVIGYVVLGICSALVLTLAPPVRAGHDGDGAAPGATTPDETTPEPVREGGGRP